MYEWIIFDIDGTLIDTEKAIINSLQKVLQEELGSHYDYEDLLFVFGIPGAVSLQQLGVKDIESARKKWDKYVEEFYHEIHVFPGIKETLQELSRRGVKTGIVTSKTREEFENDFLPFGLMDYLNHVVCADDTVKHKPNPEPLLKFLSLFGANPAKAVYIGDTIYDANCAGGAKIDFALAVWGANLTVNIDAKYKLKDPGEILHFVQA